MRIGGDQGEEKFVKNFESELAVRWVGDCVCRLGVEGWQFVRQSFGNGWGEFEKSMAGARGWEGEALTQSMVRGNYCYCSSRWSEEEALRGPLVTG